MIANVKPQMTHVECKYEAYEIPSSFTIHAEMYAAEQEKTVADYVQF